MLNILPYGLLAQNQTLIDSLKNSLKNTGAAEKIDIYNSLAWEYRKSFPDSTVFYSQKAVNNTIHGTELSHKIGKSLNIQGLGYFYTGDPIKAFELYQQAKDSALIYGDSLQYGYTLINMGRLYFNQGNYVLAYENFFGALEIHKLIGDSVSMSYGYKSLSELYQSQNNLDKALEMSLKTAEIRKTFDDPSGIISIYLEIADIYAQMQKYNSCLKYFSKAYEVANSINDAANLAIIKLSIAKMNTERGRLAIALSNANEALEFAASANNANLIIQVYALLGELYFHRANYTHAKNYFTRVKELSTSSGITYARDAYYYLYQISENEGNTQKAYSNFKKYTELREKTDNVRTARQIERLEGRLALLSKEKENELLKQNEISYEQIIEKQKAFNIALSTVIALSVILLIVLWIISTKRAKINQVLQTKNNKIKEQQNQIEIQNQEIISQNSELLFRNKELDRINNEKDSLLKLIAHDLKALFHQIRGLSELLRLTGIDEEQGQIVSMISSNGKDGVYLINDLVDVNAMPSEKKEPTLDRIELKQLLSDSVSTFVIELAKKEISTSIKCEPSLLVNSNKNYLERILEKLLSNAIKFSHSRSEIILKAGLTSKNFWISLKDFGCGFTDADKEDLFEKFKKVRAKHSNSQDSNGLGLAVVKTLVDSLNGEIKLETEVGKYSEFILYFPIQDHH